MPLNLNARDRFFYLLGSVEKRQPVLETRDPGQLLRRLRRPVPDRRGHQISVGPEQDTSVSKTGVHAQYANRAGLQTPQVRYGPVLGLLRTAVDHADAPPGGHVQDGTGVRPQRRGQPRTNGVRRVPAPGDRLLDYANHHWRAHGGTCLYDRRKGSRFDQVNVVKSTNRLTPQ